MWYSLHFSGNSRSSAALNGPSTVRWVKAEDQESEGDALGRCKCMTATCVLLYLMSWPMHASFSLSNGAVIAKSLFEGL